MEITAEYLNKRIIELNDQLMDAREQLGAIKGAIQLCHFLTQELQKEEEVTTSPQE